MNEPEDLNEIERRLRAMGDEPIHPAVATAHLTAMAGVVRPARSPRWHRTKVAAAFGAGLLLGGTSLASAGALGETAQNVVADTAANVGLNLPGGTERSTEGCPEGSTYKNHGQYVRDGGDPHSSCGKPLQSVDDDETDGVTGPSGATGNDGDEGCGPPPWAHGNHEAKTPEAVAAFQAECGNDEEPDGVTGPSGATGATGPSGATGNDASQGCGPPPWANGNHEAKTPEAVAAFAAQCGDDEGEDEPAPTTTEAPTTTTEAPTTTVAE